MNINVLDVNTLTMGDLDFSCLDALGNTFYYNVLPAEDLPAVCKDADVLLINKAEITKELLEKLPRLKYIGLFATGYNNVDLKAAADRGIVVVNVPGYSTNAVAQHAFAFILMHASSLQAYNEAVHRGEWIYSGKFSFFPYPITELAGKTLGIVGFGNIGKQSARIGKAFGMDILVYTRSEIKDPDVTQVRKEELFAKSDYLTLHCPLAEDTRHLVNAQTLKLMKKTAFLVNTSRGAVVDSVALAQALNSGRIAGAGIDVLPVEPMTADDPLFTAKNCMITPHIGWAALEARRRCVEMVADNLNSWMSGHAKNVVNMPICEKSDSQ